MTMKPKFQTANYLQEFDRLKLGCPIVDSILNGGLRTHILNEIVGYSGSGKTQVCLILSLMVQLPRALGGLNKAAVYICTEDVFPIKRLFELNYWFEQKYGKQNFLDNIFICHTPDYGSLKKALFSHLPYLVRVKNVGLIVIDSIAGIFRSDNLNVSYRDRSKQFTEISMKLRELGSKLECVLICTNQVTFDSSTGKVEPCLGLSWSNLVNNRYVINRLNPTTERKFQIVFACDLPSSECSFSITSEGLTGCKN